MAKGRSKRAGGPEGPEIPPPPSLSSKHRRTLEEVFARPTRSDITWRDLVALVRAAGGRVDAGNGSRRRFFLRGVVAFFHEPHPGNVVKKGAIADVRLFLENAGVKP